MDTPKGGWHHIAMPFSRPENGQLYANHFDARPWLRWWTITAKDCKTPDRQYSIAHTPPPGVDPCYHKLNRFLDHELAADNEYVTFMTDDNWWAWGYWERLRQVCQTTGAPVVVSQMLWPNRQLAMRPDAKAGSLGVGRCDLSQFTVRGDVLRQVRFDPALYFADGWFAEQLAALCGKDFHFALDCIVYKDMLRPEKWVADVPAWMKVA